MSEATLSLEQQFQRLGEVTRLGDGTVVVLEIEDAQLRTFDPSGDLLWTAAHEHMSMCSPASGLPYSDAGLAPFR